jgi:RNA polymerase sigma-70 factor, ECF subfamily
MGSREIDFEEADPQKRDQGVPSPGIRVEPSSNQASGFKGVGDDDAARLADFAQNEFVAVCHIVAALCGPEIDVDGAVAEATARAVEQLGRGKSIDSLSAWITRVALNVGRSENRKLAIRRRKAPLVSLLAYTDAGMDLAALRLDVQRALRELTKRQAEVVALYYGLDLSVTDVALTLGRSEGTVKATLFKARSALAHSLGSTAGDDHGTA